MAMENTVSSIFDQRSSIVKSVFDCCLSGVKLVCVVEQGGLYTDELQTKKTGPRGKTFFHAQHN